MLFKKKQHTYNKFWNQPEGTEDTVDIKNIEVPPSFRKHPPKPHKLERVEEAYITLGHLDKPITVIAETNERGKANNFVLVDGYSRYLYGKKYGMTRLPVRYITMEEYLQLNTIKEKEWHEYIRNKIEARKTKKRNIKHSA